MCRRVHTFLSGQKRAKSTDDLTLHAFFCSACSGRPGRVKITVWSGGSRRLCYADRLLKFKISFGNESLLRLSVHTQLWVKSPSRDVIVVLEVTVSRQGDGDGDRPVHLQLLSVTGQQVNRDGCNRSQLQPLFSPCRLEQN